MGVNNKDNKNNKNNGITRSNPAWVWLGLGWAVTKILFLFKIKTLVTEYALMNLNCRTHKSPRDLKFGIVTAQLNINLKQLKLV